MPKKCRKRLSQKGWCNEPTQLQFLLILTQKILMLSKRYKSTEVDCRTWLHVSSGTPWSTSSDTHQVVEIYSRAMKTQHPNVHQYLKDILNVLSKRISGDFMNTSDRHYIDFISFNLKCPNIYTHAHFPTVVK